MKPYQIEDNDGIIRITAPDGQVFSISFEEGAFGTVDVILRATKSLGSRLVTQPIVSNAMRIWSIE